MREYDILKTGFEQLNIQYTEEHIRKIVMYKDILLDWNTKINLTTITEEKDFYIKHILDSVTCLSTGYIKKGCKVIDVGTGAGFPGVPIKIMDESISITLLDSLKKRINYLEDVVNGLSLKNVELLHSRAEDAGINAKHREKYDIVLSRAVAAMNVLCEYCLPFVKIGGYFLCQKGPSYKEELEDAKKAIAILGCELVEVKEYNLPSSDINHYIIVIRKKSETPKAYPRKAGKATAAPII